MKMKRTALLVLLAVILLMCPSCTSDKRTLEVTSYDYQGLKQFEAGEIDGTRLASWYLVDNPYIDYSCYITVENGKLKVENYIPDEESSVMWGDHGYFVGVNLFEEGWVCYYPYAWYLPAYAQEPQLVVGENCAGFIKLDRQNGYVFTYDSSFMSCVAHLYSLEYSESEKQWMWNCEATFDDGINTYLFDSEEYRKCDTGLKHMRAPVINSHTISVRHAGMASILCDLDQCCKSYIINLTQNFPLN